MSRRQLSHPLGNWSVVEAGKVLATKKRSPCRPNGGSHKALRRFANDEIMLLIRRVRQR
jgi:hypothetical protein